MKYLILIIACCMATTSFGQLSSGQTDAYQQLLEKNVKQLDAAKNQGSFEDLVKKFERLKSNATDQWLPYYYTAYCKIRLGKYNKNQEFLDKAIEDLEAAQEIENNSEILVLLARAYMEKIELNSIMYGPKYTGTVRNLLQEAVKENEENPRAYLFYGRFCYYFPAFVGGSKDKAKQLFTKAQGLFEEEFKSNEVAYSSEPHWGRNLNAWHITRSF
ncbi:MAG: hypothetical protein AAFO94_20785 [Bacteroidota bacterium]